MSSLLFRIAIIIVFTASGFFLGNMLGRAAEGAITGLASGLIFVFVAVRLAVVSIGSILGSIAGLGLGLLFAFFLLMPFRHVADEAAWRISAFALSALFGYAGLVAGFIRGKSLTIPVILRMFKGQDVEQDNKLLDTSVIIDGRIADIIEAGFIEGTFIIPQFILQELQYVADSPDPMRRARGRRGLDVLQRIQKMSSIKVNIIEEDFPKIKEVDSKLVALAKMMSGKIITNDFNLNKVAQLQGVAVLNINELANVLKPVVLPGETMNLFVVKEGKEQNQGVAYLDDGTMVVIENARKIIGKNAEVTVTSVLQTTAGRMIFARLKDEE